MVLTTSTLLAICNVIRNSVLPRFNAPNDSFDFLISPSVMDQQMAADTDIQRDVAVKAKTFLFYSRRDMAFVGRLEPALTANGFEPLIDRRDLCLCAAGDDDRDSVRGGCPSRRQPSSGTQP
jgi:hypothetical protein